MRAYLEIEKLRLGDRLQVEINVDEPSRKMQIPILCVQPLIENAIKHGIALASEPGYVRLKENAARANCASPSSTPQRKSRPGAERPLVRAWDCKTCGGRLEICYGSAAALDLSSESAETLTLLRLPVATAGGATKDSAALVVRCETFMRCC